MQTTKDIEQKAEAAANIAASRANISDKRGEYEKFQRLVQAFLEDYQEDAEGFEELADVGKLADKAANLNLDGQTSESLHRLNDYVEQIKQGYKGIINLLEEL